MSNKTLPYHIFIHISHVPQCEGVKPHIEVWRSAAKCHVNSLFLLQKKIIRIMTFSPYLAHTAPIFIDLAILPFNNIFIDRISITMFKVEDELLPKSVTQLFTKK